MVHMVAPIQLVFVIFIYYFVQYFYKYSDSSHRGPFVLVITSMGIECLSSYHWFLWIYKY